MDDNQSNNGTNYEFLMDEDYQAFLRQQRDNIHIKKWTILGEKLALRFTMKDIVGELDDLGYILFR